MTKIHVISQQEVDEFLSETTTDPYVRLVQAELDTASSVVGGFAAAGQAHGYKVDTRHWTEKLMEELDIADEDIIDIQIVDEDHRYREEA